MKTVISAAQTNSLKTKFRTMLSSKRTSQYLSMIPALILTILIYKISAVKLSMKIFKIMLLSMINNALNINQNKSFNILKIIIRKK